MVTVLVWQTAASATCSNQEAASLCSCTQLTACKAYDSKYACSILAHPARMLFHATAPYISQHLLNQQHRGCNVESVVVQCNYSSALR
jgi:hypothetical protein